MFSGELMGGKGDGVEKGVFGELVGLFGLPRGFALTAA
jgi:hypothetical protein